MKRASSNDVLSATIVYIMPICNSTLQMLTNIENRLEELFEEIESLPPEKVEAAEKVSHV